MESTDTEKCQECGNDFVPDMIYQPICADCQEKVAEPSSVN